MLKPASSSQNRSLVVQLLETSALFVGPPLSTGAEVKLTFWWCHSTELRGTSRDSNCGGSGEPEDLLSLLLSNFQHDRQWKTWRVFFPGWHHGQSRFLALSESSWWPLRLSKHFCTDTHNVRWCGFVVVMPRHRWKPPSVPPDMK